MSFSQSSPGCRLVATLVLALLSGCTIPIASDPQTFNLEAGRLVHLRTPQTVALTNAYPAQTNFEVKMTSGHTWVFDLKQLTDTGIAMLRRGMEKHGMTVGPSAEKTIELRVRVTGARMQGFAPAPQTTGRVLLEARLGDGTTIPITADNTSPAGASRAFDGAVLFALNQLIIQNGFVAYMNK
jgi:hypothetical protein